MSPITTTRSTDFTSDAYTALSTMPRMKGFSSAPPRFNTARVVMTSPMLRPTSQANNHWQRGRALVPTFLEDAIASTRES
ncbi:MAG: hypothetical protein ABIQ73_00030 [Acidimicrobiales bacterium]